MGREVVGGGGSSWDEGKALPSEAFQSTLPPPLLLDTAWLHMPGVGKDRVGTIQNYTGFNASLVHRC